MKIYNKNFYIFSKKDFKLFIKLLENSLNSVSIKNEILDFEKDSNGLSSVTVQTTYSHGGSTVTIYKLNYIKYQDEDFCKKLEENLKKLIENSIKILPHLKTSKGYEKIFLPDIRINDFQEGAISSLIWYKWWFNEGDWIDKATDIIIRFCQTQFLKNGNKRFSVLLCTSFLYLHSIYLYESFSTDKYVKKWEKLVLEIANKCNYNESMNDDDFLFNCSDLLSEEELYERVRSYLLRQSYLKLL